MPLEPQTDRQYAYLSIIGTGPSSRITEILGLQPDDEWSEGDVEVRQGREKIRHFTNWKRSSGLRDTEDLNAHIRALLHQVDFNRRPKLMSLLGDYDVKVVCVSYTWQCFSFELDFRLQRELTQLGIRTWFDAYIDGDVHEMMHDFKSLHGRDAGNLED
ncbi:DUF4279 domain-containing protein [Tropicibacter sp. R15_0]|uniref:DUF4279 domain-containing protein n=1 Tax=Tropicibacter sp. R15_0 TaxID=2821101 RepID=UPI001ADCAA64|nr:DUF4279 domain-containing protein [Tropicibacter sp. R15_0]MBO9468445.1 DUF4279 domain-containing protein [Tropicibacter sp. R15_0]